MRIFVPGSVWSIRSAMVSKAPEQPISCEICIFSSRCQSGLSPAVNHSSICSISVSVIGSERGNCPITRAMPSGKLCFQVGFPFLVRINSLLPPPISRISVSFSIIGNASFTPLKISSASFSPEIICSLYPVAASSSCRNNPYLLRLEWPKWQLQ